MNLRDHFDPGAYLAYRCWRLGRYRRRVKRQRDAQMRKPSPEDTSITHPADARIDLKALRRQANLAFESESSTPPQRAKAVEQLLQVARHGLPTRDADLQRNAINAWREYDSLPQPLVSKEAAKEELRRRFDPQRQDRARPEEMSQLWVPRKKR